MAIDVVESSWKIKKQQKFCYNVKLAVTSVLLINQREEQEDKKSTNGKEEK